MAANIVFPNIRLALCFASFVACITMTTALPMKEVVIQMMVTAKSEQQQQQPQQQQQLQQEQQQQQEQPQQQQQLQQQQQQQQREKRTVAQCAQPSDLQKMFDEINANKNHSVFLQTSSISHTEESIHYEENPSESKTCPATVSTNTSAPLKERSLCPYYFDVLVLATGYFPPSLLSAKCKCQRCVHNSAYGCEASTAEITVLKPDGCFQGLRKYVEERIEVNTGCTCVSN